MGITTHLYIQERFGFHFSLFINPISIMGIEYTSTFTEIGSIAPDTDIINMRFIENDLAFLVENNRGITIYSIMNPNNCMELDYYFNLLYLTYDF